MEGLMTALTFLGITLDTQAMQASLPADKLERTRDHTHAFMISQVCSRGELQSLLSMQNFAMRIIPKGRSFISCLLALLPSAPDSDSRVKLDSAALIYICGTSSSNTVMESPCSSLQSWFYFLKS